MRNYTRWVEGPASISALLLDPENPRIPPSKSPLGQRELITELVEHDKVYELARDIAEDSWSPLELMIGLEDDGKTYVLEGNRRLCALKLLRNPSLAPATFEKKFKALAAVIEDLPDKVRVLIAPNRKQAAPLIMQKHTRSQIVSWDPLMQARFYKSLAVTGLSPDELAAQYGGKASEIAAMLRLDEMYAVACRLDLPTGVAEKVRNPRAFPATILERLLGFASTKQVLGLEYSDDGTVSGRGNPEAFVGVYRQIIKDIATGAIDSRAINKAQDAEKYLKTLGAEGVLRGRREPFAMGTLLTGPHRASTAGPTKRTDRPTRPSPPTTLIPRAFKCKISDRRVIAVFEELRTLNVRKYPNSCAVMLRILLELAVDRYLHKTGQLRDLIAKLSQKGSRGKDWAPSLDQMLVALVADEKFRLHPQALKVLNKMISTGSPQVGDLHGFIHNNYVTPTPSALHGYWEVFEPILEVVLAEPVPSKGPQ